MKKDPDCEKGRNVTISSVRHDEVSARQLEEILRDNPLYKPSAVLRGAILALYEMSAKPRLDVIIKAASHARDD